MNHLRFSGLTDAEQRQALESLLRGEPVIMDLLDRLETFSLRDGWLVSGAIYNTVWNLLTDRPPLTGIKDADIIYFDDGDLSYEAEDKVIEAGERHFAGVPLPVEIRNQARVHLWYERRFGRVFGAPLTHACASLERYASETHAVAVRLANGAMEIVAPFGLDHMFSFRIVPNTAMDNEETHQAKGLRAKSVWPEIELIPWEDARCV